MDDGKVEIDRYKVLYVFVFKWGGETEENMNSTLFLAV